MVKLEELSINQKDEYPFLKRVLPSWKEAKLGVVLEARGESFIIADYEKDQIILYKPIDELISDKIMIQKLTRDSLGYMHVIPKRYVEEITEQ